MLPVARQFIVSLTLLACGIAHAAWPDKPIRIIVPYPPGGPSDIVLRLAMEKMQVTLKQAFVLENKPGAGGNLGAAEAARAAPDGYTWFFATDTVVTVNPHVYKKLPFKVDDLVPVSVASSFSQTLVCNPAAGVKTVAELVKAAKGGTRLAYASGGAGVPGHLAMELLLTTAGIEMDHIPYKGPALAAQDVIGGQVPCGFLAGPTVLPHIKSGRLVALAVSGAKRSPCCPRCPRSPRPAIRVSTPPSCSPSSRRAARRSPSSRLSTRPSWMRCDSPTWRRSCRPRTRASSPTHRPRRPPSWLRSRRSGARSQDAST